jgi:glycerol-3-phosphate acyltransferase PlsY
MHFFTDPRIPILGGLLAVIGHCYPVYIRFKGGKGVATALGVYSALAFKPLLCVLIVFILVILLTRKVSLGSLLGALSYPICAWILEKDLDLFFLGVALFLLIALRHRSNIQRLLSGTERKIGAKTS